MFATIKSIFTPTKKDPQPYTMSLPDPTSEDKEQDDASSYVQSLIDQAEIEDQAEQKDKPIDIMDLAPSENRQLNSSMEKQRGKRMNYHGLLVSNDIQEFLNQNYFSRGRHNGVNFGDEGTLEFGLKSITSDFEMILNKMIEARNSKLNDMERTIDSVPSAFDHLATELKGKKIMVNKEITSLKEQIKLANEEKGWISPAIHNYKNGFLQGKKMAINYKF